MHSTEPSRPVRLAGSLLNGRRHVCAFFNSREEEYRVLLPFIKDGFDCGDKAVHLVGSARRDDHLTRLRSAGIDTVGAQQTCQFELRDWAETYFEGGYFDPDKWLALLEGELTQLPERGFPVTRIVAHMEWALEDHVGVERLLEYEARVNYLWPRYQNVGICTYDLARFSGDVIIDIMRTHPLVIIGGILQENPFYVEPDEFLRELRERT
jgi:DcmR-like sensory protein